MADTPFAAAAEDPTLDELVADLDSLVQDDPDRARAVAERGVEATTGARRAVFRWALGRALLETGAVAAATAAFIAADRDLDPSSSSAHVELRSRLLISRALAEAEGGDSDAALRTLDDAAALVGADGVQRVHNQRCLVLYGAGRFREALAAADDGLLAAVANHDRLTEARVAVNRGIVHLQMADLDAAEADLTRGLRVALAAEQHLMCGVIEHDLALLHARRGDIPRALRAFDDAVAILTGLGAPESDTEPDPDSGPESVPGGAVPRRVRGNLERDRAECLLLAGLPGEAAIAAARAEELAVGIGNANTAAESALLLAHALRRAGDAVAAAGAAARAERGFRAAGRDGWQAYADFVAAESRWADPAPVGAPPPVDAARVELPALAERLRACGREVEAEHVGVLAARVEWRAREPARARALLDAAAGARERGPLDLRIRAWHTLAEVELELGNAEQAERAIEQGMSVIDDHVALLASPDVRASVAAQGIELAAIGLRRARAHGDAAEVFRWSDRWRAGTLTLAALRASADEQVADLLARIRTVTTEAWDAPDATTRAELERDVEQLRAAVADRSRAVFGRAPLRAETDLAAVRAALGRLGQDGGADRAVALLVEYAIDGDVLLAVTVPQEGPPGVVELGPLAAVRHEVRHTTAAIRRLLRPRPGADLVALAEHQLRTLDALLVPPDALGAGPLVAVPVHGLHDVPWGALPSLRGRPVTVAPSAAAWAGTREHHDDGSSRPPIQVGVVAGPGLPAGEREAHELAERWGSSALPVATTVDACLDVAAQVDVLHVAAHGTFSVDNPLLGAITLDDGDLFVQDLARLERVPSTVVLAACGVARTAGVGDEVIGFAHGLLGLGSRAVVAPLVPIPDDATAPLMHALHDELRRGHPAGDALALAAGTVDAEDARALAAAWAFTCLGAA